jgi:hypothetical protein
MTHRQYWLAVACIAVSLTPRPAAAQVVCKAKETVNACLERVGDEIAGVSKAESTKVVTDVKKKTETGVQDINGLSSSVKDFLPLLQMTGLLGDVKKDETTGTVSIAWNTRLLTQDPALQVKAVFETKPKLFDELKKKLPAASRDAVEKSLLGSKTGAEHTTIHASYNVMSQRLGRNFSSHMALYNDLVLAATGGPRRERVRADSALRRTLIEVLGNEISLDKTPWAEIPEARRDAAQPIITKIVQTHEALRVAVADAIKSTGLDVFGQLVNNQPQLSITVSPAFRDDLFGPNFYSGRITFEKGLSSNLNGFFDRMESAKCAAPCLEEFAAYANSPETRAHLKAASRVAAFAEFTHHANYLFTNSDVGLNVAIPKGRSLSAGVDYGSLFGVSETGAADGRVDASLRFEYRSEAPDSTRLVASVVVTKKLGDISVPFGIVYANKPRFLTGVDKGITANVGLKFNLFQGAK